VVANFFLKKFSAALQFPLKIFFALQKFFSNFFIFLALQKNFLNFFIFSDLQKFFLIFFKTTKNTKNGKKYNYRK